MKLLAVFNKSLKEQIRHLWIFILTVTMAPLFIFIYYLITETSQRHYDVLVINSDTGIEEDLFRVNHGGFLVQSGVMLDSGALEIPMSITVVEDKVKAIELLKNRKADALIIIPENFSRKIHNFTQSIETDPAKVEFIGDLTNLDYIITAVFANEILTDYLHQVTDIPKPIEITETSLGISGSVDDFDLLVPGLLILSMIMLMFSASIALITEVENKTILRLKLSTISAFEFLTGVGLVQVLIGLIAIFLTLAVAVMLGFDFSGSIVMLMIIALITCISMIAFSLIVAACTKTANEILVVGNFPLFLFMFFTGAAFPIQGKELFSVAGYPVTLQGLMSPTYSVSALNKVMIMQAPVWDILPEMTALILVTIIYFVIGIYAFKYRHMKIQ